MEPNEPERTLLGMDTDEKLWLCAQAGDGQAFVELFDRHYRRVFNHSLRMVGSKENAEDVTATVFMEAWRKRHSVRMVNRTILPWLLVVANNTIRNWKRASHRHRHLLSRIPSPEYEPDPADEISERITTTDTDRAIRLSFGRLSRRDQEILSLCVVEELTTAEASKALRIPLGTVKSRLHRAKARLAGLVESLSAADAALVRSWS